MTAQVIASEPGDDVLHFSIVAKATGQVHLLSLRPGEQRYIGRGVRSAVHLDDTSMSSQHVELTVGPSKAGGASRLALFARDCSKNGTGLRHPAGDSSASKLWRLSGAKAEEVQHGSILVVPYRSLKVAGSPGTGQEQGQGGPAVEEEDDGRLQFVVQLKGEQADPSLQKAQQAPVLVVKPEPQEPQQPKGDVEATPPLAAAVAAASRGGLSMASNPAIELKEVPDGYVPATKAGHWRYDARLGEGGLGVVYRAFDCLGDHGEVAVKVHKPRSKIPQKDARFVFEMHRESQWSTWYIHNEFDMRHVPEAAPLFARYLEDYTGFAKFGPHGFDKKRRTFEAPDFDWDKDGPPIPERPYVVMELLKGEPLHVAIDREWIKHKNPEAPPVLNVAEKREILLQAARALEYLAEFGLIHRDFRGCNMHLVSRASSPGGVQLKVLDFGVMICAEDGQEHNSNQAVVAFRRRGETEEKRKRYDWLPWEVRAGADGTGPAVNFSPPAHSFDIFSLGVLMLHMLIGRPKTRAFLDSLQNNENSGVDTTALGVDPAMLRRMLGPPEKRPHPKEVVAALKASSARAAPTAPPSGSFAASLSRQSNAAARGSRDATKRAASRSRSPRHGSQAGGAVRGRAELTSKYWLITFGAPQCPPRVK